MKKLGLKIDVLTLRLISLIALISSPACFVPRAEGDQMHVDLSKLRNELARTQRDSSDEQKLLKQRLSKLEEAVFKQSAESNMERDKLTTQIEQLKTQLEEMKEVSSKIPASSSEPQTQSEEKLEQLPEASKNLSKADWIAAIRAAYEDKAYEKAIVSCDGFMNQYPEDRQFLAQVLYWKGNSYFELGEYKKSVLSFQDLLTRFQNFSKIPEALYKVGVSLDELKFNKDAKVFYEEIIKKYPKSPFAASAKERLKSKKK